MKIPNDIDIPVSEWERLIDEWILGDKQREILKLNLIHQNTYFEIGEKVGMSERQIARIIPPLENRLFEKARKYL